MFVTIPGLERHGLRVAFVTSRDAKRASAWHPLGGRL
jgi:hypothetical protein